MRSSQELQVMKRQVTATSLVVTALLAAGCGGGNGPDIGPTNTASGNGNPGGSTPPPQPQGVAALFQPLQGVLPYPTDLYFLNSKDGTLNIQPTNALVPLQAGVNALDGFSTTAVIRARFGGPLLASSINASTVRVVHLKLDNATKAPLSLAQGGVIEPLAFGVDYTAGLAGDLGVGNTIVEIRPKRPLLASTGTTNHGYLVILTNGIQTAAGTATTPDRDYLTFKSAPANCSGVDAAIAPLCLLTKAHLQIGGSPFVQADPATVVLTFSFSTQSTRDTMNVLANPAVTTARPITVQNTGATTKALSSSLPGHANVYAGTFTIPYYSSRPTTANPTAPLTASWQGGPSPLDATSKLLTRFNPRPVATETISIPILITVPNATSAGGATKPAGGWPVVIFQHGLTRNRLDAAAVADGLADADSDPFTAGVQGYIVASIDLPLHGIAGATATANPFYQAANERTFNLDLVDNTSLASGADGKIDPSGVHFVNVPSPLVTRDNLRQAAVDLLTLARSLPNLDLDGDGTPDVNPTRIHFIGHSLGGIVGGVFLGTAGAAEVRTGELANAGGGVAQTIFDSPAFGPRIKSGLGQQGITEGSTLYAQFIRDAQTIVDAGDPINYIASAVAARPTLLLQVVGGGTLANGTASPSDQVVVSTATQRLIDTAAVPRVSTVGDNPLSVGYVNFLFGDHGSIIDPTSSPATTFEMQTESGVFASSLGTIIRITNGAVVQP
jgi:pimeloyl-ACP methyl ester carboxylesterase